MKFYIHFEFQKINSHVYSRKKIPMKKIYEILTWKNLNSIEKIKFPFKGRIRIHFLYGSEDPDPFQNDTDP